MFALGGQSAKPNWLIFYGTQGYPG